MYQHRIPLLCHRLDQDKEVSRLYSLIIGFQRNQNNNDKK